MLTPYHVPHGLDQRGILIGHFGGPAPELNSLEGRFWLCDFIAHAGLMPVVGDGREGANVLLPETPLQLLEGEGQRSMQDSRGPN